MTIRKTPLSLARDDRGAVMVMGIFMCSCLAASLWYLAGIGDAILYRERMQEAADAVAFSDAALHARGMNLIVLINLVMAVILAVRVAVRVGKLVMTLAAVIFSGLAIINPGLLAAIPPTTAAAVLLNNADNAMKPIIDGALRGLNGAQEVLAEGTPLLSHAGVKVVVGQKYEIAKATATIEPAQALPVEKRLAKKLCGEAAAVVPKISAWMLEKVHLGALGEALKIIGGLLTSIAEASPDFFCDLESGNDPPNTDSHLDKPARDRCSDLSEDGERKHFNDAEERWQEACRRHGVACTGRDGSGQPLVHGTQGGSTGAKEQAELDRLRLERDQSARSLAERTSQVLDPSFDETACMQSAKEDMKRRQTEKNEQSEQQAPTEASSSSSSGVMPMLIRDFKNGAENGQIIAGVRGDTSRLQAASKIVRISAFKDKRTRPLTDSEPAQMPAWAQAEMFYDCSGAWTDEDCDQDDEAMWHFKWRARLRRFNQPTEESLATLSIELVTLPPRLSHERFAESLAEQATAPAAGFRSNAALRAQLAKALSDPTTRKQGVH